MSRLAGDTLSFGSDCRPAPDCGIILPIRTAGFVVPSLAGSAGGPDKRKETGAMAYTITDKCSTCGKCADACNTEAIDINKKEKNINQYRKIVDQIYLLIIEGFNFSGNLGQFEFKGSLTENNFDKIFLLQILSRRLHEIK